MKQLKKVIALLLALALCLAFAACGGEEKKPVEDQPETENGDGLAHVVIGATPAPHAEILNALAQDFIDNGVEVEVKEYTDYVVPNTALADGSIDANYFQHQPYLTDFNEKHDTDLVSIASVHYEPFAIYGGKTASLEELADGAVVSVPNDPSNEARALNLLEAAGLIVLKEGVGLDATVNDIEDNPKNLKIMEIEAAQLPRSLPDVDISVINGNYAIDAGLSVAKDAIFIEDKESEAAQLYANILAVRADETDNEALAKVVEVLTSEASRKYMEETYDGGVVPMF